MNTEIYVEIKSDIHTDIYIEGLVLNSIAAKDSSYEAKTGNTTIKYKIRMKIIFIFFWVVNFKYSRLSEYQYSQFIFVSQAMFIISGK